MTKLSTKNKIQRRSKEDWFEEALKVLEVGGVDAIVIEHLAARLKISKSGFYWHFKNRSDLLDQVLRYWSEEYTEIVINQDALKDFAPRDKLFFIARMVYENDLAKYDLAIRVWAKYEVRAKRIVKKVNNLRMELLRSVFTELGFEGDELEARTKLFVCYQTFESPMFGKTKKNVWENHLKLRIKMLTDK